MTKMKRSMMALMRRMMLNCEEASFISTKKIIQGVSIKDNMNLHVHLAACKHCRKYYTQTKIITRALRHHAKLGETIPVSGRMSSTEKSKLQKLISNKIKSQ